MKIKFFVSMCVSMCLIAALRVGASGQSIQQLPPTIQSSSQSFALAQPGGTCIDNECAPSLPNVYPGMILFGDSVGCGYLATNNTTISNTPPVPPIILSPNAPQFFSPIGFPWLLAPDFGGPFLNYCNGGDQSADMVREWVMPYVQPTDARNPTYLIEIGGNDAIGCQTGTDCISDFTYALQAAVAWLAIPTNCKIYGQQTAAASLGGGTVGLSCPPLGPVSPTGTWSDDNFPSIAPYYSSYSTTQPAINGVALSTVQSGAALTIPITTLTPDQNVYCAWRVRTASNSSYATFSIDGNSTDTWYTHFMFGTSGSTGNGTTDTIFARFYSIPTTGSHSLSIVASASSGNPFSFVWCGLAPQPATVSAQYQATLISATPSGSLTSYGGTIYGGNGNALAGLTFNVVGFTNSANNGTFVCHSSSSRTLVLNNSSGVSEGPNSSPPVNILATATSTTGYTISNPSYEVGQPRVIINGIPNLGTTAPSSVLALYDNAAQAVASAFAQDGLQVSIAQIRTYVSSSDIYGTGPHLTVTGHQHVRDAYEAAVANGAYQSRVSAPLASSCPAYTTTATGSPETYICPIITAASKCHLQPTNAVAAGMLTGTYILSKSPGYISILHPGTAGATFDVICTQD